MIVAVSATGKDLNSQVDPRFGRCQNFLIVNTDTMEFEAIENPNINASGGAGIQRGLPGWCAAGRRAFCQPVCPWF